MFSEIKYLELINQLHLRSRYNNFQHVIFNRELLKNLILKIVRIDKKKTLRNKKFYYCVC